MRELRISGICRPFEGDNQDAVRLDFRSESACENLLKKRFDRAFWRCPRCGSAEGHWLPSRRCWECALCRRQTGLRIGTVIERSRIPLLKWFAAIEYVLRNQHPRAAELGQKIKIDRAETVRRLLARIRTALNQSNSSELLAGLDAYFGGRSSP
jgi:transposase-like protein